MIRVNSQVKIYEIDATEVEVSYDKSIRIENHWNMNDRVVLHVGEKAYTVSARDLKAAIENATNVSRYL